MLLVTFFLGRARYAVPAEAVLEVVARVETTPLRAVPDSVVGAISYRGSVVPVVDLRRRFAVAAPSRLDDHFIVARTARRTLALVVERVEDVVDIADATLQALKAEVPHVRGAFTVGEQVVLLHDLELTLGLDEEAAVHAAMAAVESC